MTQLHQIIAIERGVVAETDKHLADIKRVLAIGGDNDPLTGISRVYESRRGEEGDQLPEQYRKVQFTARELLENAQDYLTRLFDLKFTREFANCEARADVKLNGRTLVADVPAGYLLFLETQVSRLITELIDRLPVLNPADDWHSSADDHSLPDGVYASAPRKTERTRRVPKFQVMVDPTPEHRAEIRQWETDEIEGYWTTIKLSGQLSSKDVQEMRARAIEVLEAVRYAREHANTIEVRDREAGGVLLGYITTGE